MRLSSESFFPPCPCKPCTRSTMNRSTEENSVISVPVGPATGGGAPSSKRLVQLEQAREKSVVSRKLKQHDRLQQKLAELRASLGSDFTSEHLTRVAAKLLQQEEDLRSKQNKLTTAVNDHLDLILAEIRRVSKEVERLGRSSSHSSASSFFSTHSQPRPRSPRTQRSPR